MELLYTKREQIINDVEVIDGRMRELEKEHAERVIQLHELRGAQRVVDSLIAEVENARSQQAELVSAAPESFSVGDKVRAMSVDGWEKEYGVYVGLTGRVEDLGDGTVGVKFDHCAHCVYFYPHQLEKIEKRGFSVGDRVARSSPTGSAARDSGTIKVTDGPTNHPFLVSWDDGVIGYYSVEELAHV